MERLRHSLKCCVCSDLVCELCLTRQTLPQSQQTMVDQLLQVACGETEEDGVESKVR